MRVLAQGEPLPRVRVGNLVVILIEHDELLAGIAFGRSAMPALAIDRSAAVRDKSVSQSLAQISDPAKVGEIAIPGTGQQGMQ